MPIYRGKYKGKWESNKPIDNLANQIRIFQAAGATRLERLGIFGMSFLPRYAMLLQAFRRHRASVTHLVLATNSLPRPAWIALLADDFPNLVSLSLFGRNRIQDAFQWPAQPEAYGRALGFFGNLRVFEANAAWPTARDIVVNGLATAVCNARARFAQDLARSCPTMVEIAFHPRNAANDSFGVTFDSQRQVWPQSPVERSSRWWE